MLTAGPARARDAALDPGVAAALDQVDRMIAGEVGARAIPGLAIAIVHGRDLMWHHFYGEAGPRTRFGLGSISKLFTALAIVRLDEDGLLRLDDKVTVALPWFRLAGVDHPQITLRDLLIHRAGLARDPLHTSWTDRVMPTRATLIDDMAEEPAVFPPGTMWKYSNLGYAVLGLTIEAASGESYADYVTRAVLAPLGMTRTVVDPPPDLPDLAPAHDAGEPRPRPFEPMGALTPAAGIVSTADDMARLAAWMLDDAATAPVSSLARREMLRVQAVFPDWSGGQGLGFETRRVDGADRIGHAGRAGGYAGRIEVDPARRLGVVVLINSDENGPTRLIDHVIALLAPAVSAVDASPPPIADPSWGRYVGVYASTHGRSAIVVTDGRLAWQDANAPDPARTRIYLDPAGPDQFRFAAGGLIGEVVRFEADTSGRITGMTAGGATDRRE